MIRLNNSLVVRSNNFTSDMFFDSARKNDFHQIITIVNHFFSVAFLCVILTISCSIIGPASKFAANIDVKYAFNELLCINRYSIENQIVLLSMFQ